MFMYNNYITDLICSMVYFTDGVCSDYITCVSLYLICELHFSPYPLPFLFNENHKK
jgi:hypothetical protein